jgi:hypothetical protein
MNNYCKPISLSSLICGFILIWLPLTEYLMILDTNCVLNKTTEINNLEYTLQITELISYMYVIIFSINTYILITIITSRDIIYRCSEWSSNYKIFIYASIVMIIYWILSMGYTIHALNLSADIKLSIELKNISQCANNTINLTSFCFYSIVFLLVILFVSVVGTI